MGRGGRRARPKARITPLLVDESDEYRTRSSAVPHEQASNDHAEANCRSDQRDGDTLITLCRKACASRSNHNSTADSSTSQFRVPSLFFQHQSAHGSSRDRPLAAGYVDLKTVRPYRSNVPFEIAPIRKIETYLARSNSLFKIPPMEPKLSRSGHRAARLEQTNSHRDKAKEGVVTHRLLIVHQAIGGRASHVFLRVLVEAFELKRGTTLLGQYNDQYAIGIKKGVVSPPGDHIARVLPDIVLPLPRS